MMSNIHPIKDDLKALLGDSIQSQTSRGDTPMNTKSICDQLRDLAQRGPKHAYIAALAEVDPSTVSRALDAKGKTFEVFAALIAASQNRLVSADADVIKRDVRQALVILTCEWATAAAADQEGKQWNRQ